MPQDASSRAVRDTRGLSGFLPNTHAYKTDCYPCV